MFVSLSCFPPICFLLAFTLAFVVAICRSRFWRELLSCFAGCLVLLFKKGGEGATGRREGRLLLNLENGRPNLLVVFLHCFLVL